MSVIKKPNVKTKYSLAQIQILKKCSQDPIFFIRNFIRIIHPIYGEVPFNLYGFQEKLVNIYDNNRLSSILWPRQSGKTETTVAYLLWYAMFHPNKTILVAAHKFDHVQEIISRMKRAYEFLPDWIKCGVVYGGYNRRSLTFENGSTIQGITTAANSGRGYSISILYMDEFAHVPPNLAREFWASILPTISTGGKCFITSTPNNDDDEFAQIWFGATNIIDENPETNPNGLGRNEFKAYQAYWWEHPDRDQQWADSERAKIGDARFKREFLCEFVSFSETLINPIFLNEELNKTIKDPIMRTGAVKWFQPILPNKTYLVGLDPSMGTGGDFASIQIFQLPEMVQVGEWFHNMTIIPVQLKVLQNILRYIFNEISSNQFQIGEPQIFWTVENNSVGEAAIIVINETGEENFAGELITESKKRGRQRAYRKGFSTTGKSKIESCAKLKSMIESKRMVIHSRALIRELKFFVAEGISYKAKTGEHDDNIMATILCLRMIQELMLWDEKISDKLSENVGFGEEEIEPLPTVIF